MHISEITAVILAGGRSQRMGECNKALLELGGKPLIGHVIARLSPQLTNIVISANDDFDAFHRFGLPVVADKLPEYPGPLAGLYSVMNEMQSEWLLSVPCDTPVLPADYVARMRSAVGNHTAAVAYDGQRIQSGFCLLHRSLLQNLDNTLKQKHYAVYRFLAEVDALQVDFSDQVQAFANINTPQQLNDYQSRLAISITEHPDD